MIELGIKSDPIETRYSYEWLFDLLVEEGIKNIQFGSFFEMYSLDDEYFVEVREKAESRGLKIKSMFTAHRELGGFFYNNKHMEKVARKNYERFIEVGALLGCDYVGSNPGAVYRDRYEDKIAGIKCYNKHMKELVHQAKDLGIKALTIEPMSSLAEPPSTPNEIQSMMEELNGYHQANKDNTVPVYCCSDISHGVADENKKIIHTNTELFEFTIPWMNEFHFKNTDSIYNSTFGFLPEEVEKGIVDLAEFKKICEDNESKFPVNDVVGYLEIMGTKIGRDYSDPLLADHLRGSLRALKNVF